MRLTKMIKVRVDVPGIHQWPEAPAVVSWLKWPHRHLFQIRVGWVVCESNRELEFFIQQEKVREAVRKAWRTTHTSNVTDFGQSSCETIAETLAMVLDAAWCEVSEDGENSVCVAVIERDE